MELIDTLTNKQKKYVNIKKYPKNSVIFNEGSLCDCIGIIQSGSIKISSYSPIGNELIYNIINENEVFGNHLVYSKDPYYKGDVVCLEDCTVAFINKDDLTTLLEKNDNFLNKYLEIESDFSKSLNSKIKILSTPLAKDRLLLFLKEKNSFYKYKTISSLAVELNLQRETLSRTISYLTKQKIISHSNKELRIIGSYDNNHTVHF